MAITKRIVCLANSRKYLGRCIAGRELIDDTLGAWVRPVSDQPYEAISEIDRQYADGGDPRVLDIIDVPVLQYVPKDHQQENWLIEPAEYWVKVGRFSWHDLGSLATRSGPLWLNGSSTYNGLNDRVPIAEAATINHSLTLIYIEKMRLKVFRPGQDFGDNKRRIQANFRFSGVSYALRVTDPMIERLFLAKADGEYSIDEAYLTISLGEPYKDHYYKLVAAVIGKDS